MPLDNALDVIAGFGKRDAFDPVYRIDLGIAGIAVTLNPFLDPAAAGIVAGKCEHIRAVVVGDVVGEASSADLNVVDRVAQQAALFIGDVEPLGDCFGRPGVSPA
jgi:hypothetical protein